MARNEAIISHWYQFVENFQTSPLGFYEALDEALERRRVPELTRSRVDYKEGGLLTANREYVRIIRGKNAFDICAAPFGTGFFFSWWMVKILPSYGLLYTIGLGFVIFVLEFLFLQAGFNAAILFTLFGLPCFLALLGHMVRSGDWGIEDTVLAMPVVGPLYERLFQPATYYKADTAMMFQEAVHNAALEVIDRLTAEKGARGLSEHERKPVLKAFARSA